MKFIDIKLSLSLLILLTVLSCQNRSTTIGKSSNTQSTDSIEHFNVKDSILRLTATPQTDGEICLKYYLNHFASERDLCFKYFDYSDVIFPNISVGILNGHSFRKSNYGLIHDSILVLPLIGMNDFMSVYVLNLASQQILANDIRTSMELVWIDEKKSTFLLSDTPLYINDTTYLYKLKMYKITGSHLSIVRTDTIHMPIDVKDDLRVNYTIAQRILYEN
ncbi:hypothetical protein DVR12_17785 [Chitinophaga silvatica]|uniref:Lipoprotein n=1 Tax=Chitinophaga silvatica TaxID=2282649 RepID=A0A3E1Y801_9BACT|nr:hypothetical protein [Chitinophaga silvatica]RFS21185.1 hypothetical protein DVR12_17785 [Chitinophaga silvatica]